MQTVLRFPDVGNRAGRRAQLRLARWLVAPGATVTSGAAVAEVESDQGALLVVHAPQAGLLLRHLVRRGARVQASQDVLLMADAPGEERGHIAYELATVTVLRAPGADAPPPDTRGSTAASEKERTLDEWLESLGLGQKGDNREPGQGDT